MCPSSVSVSLSQRPHPSFSALCPGKFTCECCQVTGGLTAQHCTQTAGGNTVPTVFGNHIFTGRPMFGGEYESEVIIPWCHCGCGFLVCCTAQWHNSLRAIKGIWSWFFMLKGYLPNFGLLVSRLWTLRKGSKMDQSCLDTDPLLLPFLSDLLSTHFKHSWITSVLNCRSFWASWKQ